MLRLINFTIPANGSINAAFDADYIRVKTAAIPFEFKTRGGDSFILLEGEEAFIGAFQTFAISNNTGADQDISLFIGKNGAKVGSAKVSGAITVTNNTGLFTQGRASVTNINQVLIAANADRRYLLIQNNDLSAVLRITVNGLPAAAGQGFRVGPGDSFELPTYCASAAINAFMESASASVGNVEFVEG